MDFQVIVAKIFTHILFKWPIYDWLTKDLIIQFLVYFKSFPPYHYFNQINILRQHKHRFVVGNLHTNNCFKCTKNQKAIWQNSRVPPPPPLFKKKLIDLSSIRRTETTKNMPTIFSNVLCIRDTPFNYSDHRFLLSCCC